ncbi:MAG: OmpA family protein [Pyrinomonadaceae bacterium]
MKRCLTALLLLVLAATAPAARGEGEEKKVTLRGHELALPEPVKFKAGSDKIEAAGDASLRLLADYLKGKRVITLVRVEGHTAAGREGSQGLSERRALAVARRLSELGVDCKRLVAVGFGDTKPLEAGGGEANERVAFFNAALGGRLIGGMPADGGGRNAGEVCKK